MSLSKIYLKDFEQKELLANGNVKVYRDFGFPLFQNVPLDNNTRDYLIYILQAETKTNVDDMYPTLCKLHISDTSIDTKKEFIENPFGKKDELVQAYKESDASYIDIIQCTESGIDVLMKNNLVAHGLSHIMHIYKSILKSKSFISLDDERRFIIYCWCNEYTLMYKNE